MPGGTRSGAVANLALLEFCVTFHLRIARATGDLETIVRFYRDGLDFEVIGRFEGHVGFDGAMLGKRGLPWHLEFTEEHGAVPPPPPHKDHLLVLYLPEADLWQAAVDRMVRHGYAAVLSHNPYWDARGKTFEDPDGYRVVLQRAAWPPEP